jgi:hypothetical protein
LVSAVVVVFLLNVLNAVVALLTSYYSYKFNRLARNPLLTSISAGFMLLGIGLAFEAFTSVFTGKTVIENIAIRTLVGYSIIVYLLLQLIAYILIAVGYGLSAYSSVKSNAVTSVILALQMPARIRPQAEIYLFTLSVYFFTILALAFILFQGLLVHSRSRDRFSLLVLLAFALIFVAHVILLISVIQVSQSLLLLGDVVQFGGFVSLLVFIIRSGSVGSG